MGNNKKRYLPWLRQKWSSQQADLCAWWLWSNNDTNPEYRCKDCSEKKLLDLKKRKIYNHDLLPKSLVISIIIPPWEMRVSYSGYYLSFPNWWCGFDSRYPLQINMAAIVKWLSRQFVALQWWVQFPLAAPLPDGKIIIAVWYVGSIFYQGNWTEEGVGKPGFTV